MSDDTRPASRRDEGRRRWPAGVLGMLALIAAVEAGLARHGRQFGTMLTADWRREPSAAASDEAVRAEVLCFGDSLIKTGVVPAALEARLDRPIYNLAGMNAPAPANYFLLRRALDAGARPRAIVLDAHEPQLWGKYYRGDAPVWAEIIGPAEAWDLGRADHDPGFIGPFLVNHALASARFRLDVRKTIVNGFAPDPALIRMPWEELVGRQTRRNRGALLLSSAPAKYRPDPYPGGVVPAAEWHHCFRNVAFAHPTNLHFLDRFFRLAGSRGIPVFFLVPPIHPGVLAARERLGLEAEYLGFFRRVAATYENVVVVDGRHAGFDYPQFVDTCHLHVEAATAMSGALADVIARRLDGLDAGEHWVTLAPYAEPTARLAVEPLDETLAAVAWRRILRQTRR